MSRARERNARRRNAISYLPSTKSASAIRKAKVQFPQWAMNLFRPFLYKIVYGGRGAARSWSFARAILLICAKKSTRVLCTREIQSSLKDSVHQILRDQIELMGLDGFIITDREIRHVNGSLILFAGLRNNVTKIKSIEGIDICWVEEAERVSKESWRVLIPTIRKSSAEIWVSFNPDLESDATWQRFIVKRPPRSFILKVNGDANPWFTDRLREERDYDYAVDAEAADHIWGGNLRTANDAQIMRGKWIVEDFEVPMIQDPDTTDLKQIPLWNGPYQGMDFGFSSDPFAAVRCWIWDHTLYIEHEAYGLGVEIDKATTFTLDAIPDFERYRTRADSSRPDSISYLRRHGLKRVRAAKKGPNSVEDGIAHLRRFKQIVIHTRCTHMRIEAKLYSYKVDKNSGDVLPIVVDKHNHLWDSVRYALEPIMKRQMRVSLFTGVDGIARPICPVCSSYLPDDGKCVHCGHDEQLDGATDPTIFAPSDEKEVIMPVAIAANGDGNGNGNGKSPLAGRLTRMRGLNG